MGLTVASDQPRPVNRKDYRRILQTDIVYDLVVGTLQKGRIHRHNGISPPTARPAAKVTACSSAMPTSKNRSGKTFLNRFSPVPSGMAAVIATILLPRPKLFA